MALRRINIWNTNIVFVGKYRYSKKGKEDYVDKFSTWRDWKLGIWFRRSKMVGSKNFYNSKKWGNDLVNDYTIGINLLIFVGWINWDRGGIHLEIKENEKR